MHKSMHRATSVGKKKEAHHQRWPLARVHTHIFNNPKNLLHSASFVTDSVLQTPFVTNELQPDPDPLCRFSLSGRAGLLACPLPSARLHEATGWPVPMVRSLRHSSMRGLLGWEEHLLLLPLSICRECLSPAQWLGARECAEV